MPQILENPNKEQMQPQTTPIFGSWFLNMKNIKKDYYKTIITIMAVNQCAIHETHTEYLR